MFYDTLYLRNINDDIIKYSQSKIITTLTVTARYITLYYSKLVFGNDYFHLKKKSESYVIIV